MKNKKRYIAYHYGQMDTVGYWFYDVDEQRVAEISAAMHSSPPVTLRGFGLELVSFAEPTPHEEGFANRRVESSTGEQIAMLYCRDPYRYEYECDGETITAIPQNRGYHFYHGRKKIAVVRHCFRRIRCIKEGEQVIRAQRITVCGALSDRARLLILGFHMLCFL